MVCSACGYENLAGHRFCGMCGVPLPHRPLTAPGANSTLDLTRVPLDQAGSQYSAAGRTGVLAEPPAAASSDAVDSNRSAQIAADPRMSIDEAVAAERAAISSPEPPPKELVPDLPLEEYVKSFRYEPPRDATEITMRGDASVQEAAAPAGETPVTSSSSSTTTEVPSTSATDSAPPSPVAPESATTAVTPPEAKPVSDPPLPLPPMSTAGWDWSRKLPGRDAASDLASSTSTSRRRRMPSRAPRARRPSWGRRSWD